jgi:hypothetical protein
MGTVPERSYALKYWIRRRRKQYGLKHQILMTIHTAMGQTLNGVVSKVTSQAVDLTYSLWIASQVVVAFIVKNKLYPSNCLCRITKRNMWCYCRCPYETITVLRILDEHYWCFIWFS